MKEAAFYKKKEAFAECGLCFHNCKIKDGKYGFCLARKNIKNVLYSANYGKIVSAGVDPIEKKPLYHFHPSKGILSIGSFGCNLKCFFCQNWSISQNVVDADYVPPSELLNLFKKSGTDLLAYTYNEPFMSYDYITDTAPLIKDARGKTVLVTNGVINKEPLKKLTPFVDAANIDLKTFSEQNYKKIKGDKESVLNTIKKMYDAGVHIEITTLIVTDFNDNLKEIEDIADFIRSLNKNIPFHLSAYFPNYKWDSPPTAGGFLKEAISLAKQKLNFVYGGNTSAKGVSDTVCPECGETLIKRSGYATDVFIKEKKCFNCSGELSYFVL